MIQYNIPIQIRKEGETVVIYTPALDVCGYGKTADEAKKDFDAALKIFFEETKTHGTLEKALEELGWKKVVDHNKPRWQQPPIELMGESIQAINLPV